jgi:hypothetical protein
VLHPAAAKEARLELFDMRFRRWPLMPGCKYFQGPRASVLATFHQVVGWWLATNSHLPGDGDMRA